MLSVGIEPGEERFAEGIRIRVAGDGETVWMHGKWLDLAPDHCVLWLDPGSSVIFERPDGRRLTLGAFPAWIVRGAGKRPAVAAMFNASQFRGGSVTVKARSGAVKTYVFADPLVA